jgi:hypothetical protein
VERRQFLCGALRHTQHHQTASGETERRSRTGGCYRVEPPLAAQQSSIALAMTVLRSRLGARSARTDTEA